MRLGSFGLLAFVAFVVGCNGARPLGSDLPLRDGDETTSAVLSAPSRDPLPTTVTPGSQDETPVRGTNPINHLIVTGQSNAIGIGATPPLSTASRYGNLMFDTGVLPVTTCDGAGCRTYQKPTGFLPLVEGDRYVDTAVETPASGLANQASRLAVATYRLAKHDMLVSANGRAESTYACLRKGGCDYRPDVVDPFDQALRDVAAGRALASARGATYAVRGVVAIHGESDHYAYSRGLSEFPLDGTDGRPAAIADYADALLEWQRDYESSVTAITGQRVGVPLFVSQISGWTDAETSRIPQMQLDAHVRSAGKVVLVTPSYALGFREDCLHFDAAGSRRLGEYIGKAYARVVLGGMPWEPLRPASVTRSGAVITVKYLVPKPPLVFDVQTVTDPGNKGFVFTDGTGARIQSVALAGDDAIAITLDRVPSGPMTLSYAQNQVKGSCLGPGTSFVGGARGNVRDSDDTPSESGGAPLANWGVQFVTTVP